MRKIIYLIINLAFASQICFGSQIDPIISVGNLCEHVASYQTNVEGNKNFCSFNPVISVGVDFPLSSQFSLFPQANVGLPKKSRVKNITKQTYSTVLNLIYSPHSFPLNYKLGVGIFFTRISGDGGKIILNNGSDLEEFQIPGKVRTASNLILNTGINYKIIPQISTDLYSFIFNLEDKNERSFSLGLNINYHLGVIE